MEAVYIFFRTHRQQNAFRIDLLGKRELDENTVDLVTPVQVVDQLEQLVRADVIFRRELLAVDAQLFAGFYLVANVDLRTRIVADQNDRQSRPGACLGEPPHFRDEFSLDVVRDLGSVEDSGWHREKKDSIRAQRLK